VKDKAWVRLIQTDWRQAKMTDNDRVLLEYAEKLTRSPAEIEKEDIEAMREEGYSDEAIHLAAQVTAYFNYINRISDGLGVDLEDFMPPKPKHD
jgi:uncharacterized peroxidase-related enzyme